MDPNYIKNIPSVNNIDTPYPLVPLGSLLTQPPMYGANEMAVEGNRRAEVRYIRITDIDAHGNLQNDDWKTAKIVDKKYTLNENDILFARSGATAGKAFIYQREHGKAIFAGYLIRFRFDRTRVNPLFVFYYTQLSRYRSWVRIIQGPSGQPNINAREFSSFHIPLPPQDIQEYIIEIMQSAYAKKRQKDQEADRLLDSIDDYMLAEMGIEMPEVEEKKCFVVYAHETSGRRIDSFYYQNFYYAIENLMSRLSNVWQLGELLQMLDSGRRPKGGVANLQYGVLSFGGEHINNQCEIEINTPKYIPFEFHSSHMRTATQLNDLLLVKDGATTGKIGIVNCRKHIGQNINEHLFLLRTRADVNPIYLLNYLNSRIGKLQIQREISGGTVTGITRDVVKRLRIILPDTIKQSEIADHITGIRNEIRQLQQEAHAIVDAAKGEVERILMQGASG